MSNDESFDREVQATLEHMAGEPAPERLVARVSAIATEEPSVVPFVARMRRSGRGVASGFAALAAVLALAVAAIVLRPAAVPAPGSSPTPSPTVEPSVPVTAAPSTTAPATAPVAQASPTPIPASPSAVAGSKVPADFRPLSVTFVSADIGWVLGSSACATGRCPVIAHTLDGGRSWRTVSAPRTSIGVTGHHLADLKGVAGLRFADAHDGWAFGPELWVTHDGGVTWKRVDYPLAGAAVLALASARGTVHAVAYDTLGSTDFRIASAPVGSDAWTLSSLSVPVGGGPVPDIQLVLSGDGGWVLENDRVAVAGARLVGKSWRAWDPPCLDVVGQAYLAASTADDLVAACDLGMWGPPPAGMTEGGYLFVSHDGGVTFAKAGPKMPFALGAVVATPSTKHIFVAGGDGQSEIIEGSFDGGHMWVPVHDAGSVGLTEFGFTTPTQGVAIATASSGTSHLLMTRDGGHTWSTVHFAMAP